MTDMHRGVITLLRSALTGDKLTLPNCFDLEQAYFCLANHQILPLAYLGAVQCGVPKQLPVMRKLFRGYCYSLQYSEGQLAAVDRVCRAFDEAGVEYMPLKGCNLKPLYPKPELRPMGDADILIREEQYDLICGVMKRQGFRQTRESDHELIWENDALTMELHKRLVPSYNMDYHSYFGDGWRLAKACSATRYAMSMEDEYIYIFTHLAKHYRDGGIGCRQIADLWVYERAYPDLNWSYITTELKKLKLDEFHGNVHRLVRVWFQNVPSDEKTDFITDVIFRSGSWGEREQQKLAATVREGKNANSLLGAKLKRTWKLMFPSRDQMKEKYRILKKVPILLVPFWIVRLSGIVFARGRVSRYAREFSRITPERTQAYQQSLNYVGLDFNFEE